MVSEFLRAFRQPANARGFIAVALLARWLPARRATRVDPLTALRAE